MPRLECTVKTCYNNKENRCCLEGIHVEGMDASVPRSTACGNFRERQMETMKNECGCTRSPENVLNVTCDAVKCMFNDSCKCIAEHIGIAGNGAKNAKETECASFVNKAEA